MNSQYTRYTNSGLLRLSTLPIAVLAAIAAAFGGLFYYFVESNIPYLPFPAFVTALFGGLLGVLAYGVCRRGHCRNRLAGLLIGVLLAASAISTSFWQAYHSAFKAVQERNSNFSQAEIEKEFTFQKWVQLRKEQGWNVKISFNGDKVKISNLAVSIIWTMEALIVAGLALVGGWLGAGVPYCENCSQWLNSVPIKLPRITTTQFLSHAESGDPLSILKAIPCPNAPSNVTLVITGLVCRSCSLGFLSVEQQETCLDKRGHRKIKRTSIFRNVLMNQAQRNVSVNRGAS